MDRTIASLPGMNEWLRNLLQENGIKTTGDLLNRSGVEILKIKRMGIGRAKRLHDCLMAIGIEPNFTLEQAFDMEKKKDALKAHKLYLKTRKSSKHPCPAEALRRGNLHGVSEPNIAVPTQMRIDLEDLTTTVNHLKAQIDKIFARLEVVEAAYQTTPRAKSGILKFFKR